METEVAERTRYRLWAPALMALTGALLLGGCMSTADTVPAAAPTTTIVVPAPSTTVQRVYMYPEGRYQLYGNGTADAPYYWVWIPAGTNPPMPPPLPRTVVP